MVNSGQNVYFIGMTVSTFQLKPTPIPGAFILQYGSLSDSRGEFFRTYCTETFRSHDLEANFTQMNHSITTTKGCIRGMHYQIKPCEEVKLVRSVKGKVFDVMVDLRKGPNFLKWHGVILDEDVHEALYIPRGVAHGFQTLTDRADLVYMHSTSYDKDTYRAVRYNDPKIGITWPLPISLVSDKDSTIELLTPSFEGYDP